MELVVDIVVSAEGDGSQACIAGGGVAMKVRAGCKCCHGAVSGCSLSRQRRSGVLVPDASASCADDKCGELRRAWSVERAERTVDIF